MSIVFNGVGLRIWTPPEDFKAVADFYGETLGLKCTWRSDDDGIAVFELGFGPTVAVERSERTPKREPLFGRATGFSLIVPDIEAAYREMIKRNVPFDGPPTRQYWGGVMAFFKDPGGNEHTLMQRPDHA
jgi:catechol 2,3-dioxygenase-like lactoylglutathione lyase family enzyme